MDVSASLVGRHVRLEPLSHAHAAGLLAAASEARDSFAFTFVPDDAAAVADYIDHALKEAATDRALPFATVDSTGRVVGSTRLYNFERWTWTPHAPPEPTPLGPDAVELGFTWLAPSAQRTAVNSEAKLLLLGHAFDAWRVRRVTLKTDARNQRSRTAIARLGCHFDGVWRAHMAASDGTVRDTAFFSLLRDEWPAARERLAARLRDHATR